MSRRLSIVPLSQTHASLAVMLLLAVLVAPPALYADDFYVDGVSGIDDPMRSGSKFEPYKTINYAGDRATPATAPNSIYVAEGTYVEFLFCDADEKYYGGYDPETWQRDIEANETIITPPPLPETGAVVVLADDCLVDGFTITGGNVDLGGAHPDLWDQGAAIICGASYLGHVDNAVIANCTITENTATADGLGPIIMLRKGSLRITNSRITDNDGHALVTHTGNFALDDNLIADNTGSGIWIMNHGGAILGANLILRNAIGIEMRAGWLNDVHGVEDTSDPGLGIHNWSSWEDSFPVFPYCIIADNTGLGIYANNNPGAEIMHTIVANNGGGAFFLPEETDHDEINRGVNVLDSIIVGNGKAGYCANVLDGHLYLWDNLLVDNGPVTVYAAEAHLMSINNSVLYNAGGYVATDCEPSDITLLNDLLWGNVDDLDFTDVDGFPVEMTQDIRYCNIEDGDKIGLDNNIQAYPDFIGKVATGTITALSFEPDEYLCEITDSAQNMVPGALSRSFLWTNGKAFFVHDNTATTITVYGDIAQVASTGDSYNVWNYHIHPLSLCVDGGFNDAALSVKEHDFEADRRDLGGGEIPDIGADEVRLLTNLEITPLPANETTLLIIRFNTTVPLVGDPTVIVDGNPATLVEQVGPNKYYVYYEYNYQVTLADGEGSKLVSVTAQSVAGTTETLNRVVKFDFSPPAAPVITMADYLLYEYGVVNIVLEGTCVADIKAIHVNGSAEHVAHAPDETQWYYIAPGTQGDNDFSVTAFDEAGNESAPAITTVTVPVAPPPAPVITTNGGEDFHVSSLTVTLDGTCDAGTNAIHVHGSTGGDVFVHAAAYTPGNTTWTYTYIGQETDVIDFDVVAVDALGNESLPDSITVTIDLTPPEAPVITTNGGDDFWQGLTLTVNLQGTCPADAATIEVNDSTTGVTHTPGALTWSFTGVGVEGPNEFSVVALDAAANSSPEDTITVYLDVTPPPAPIITTNGGEDFLQTLSLLVELEGTCSVETYTIEVNGPSEDVAYAPGTTAWAFAGVGVEGLNTFSVVALDDVGNPSPADTITVTIQPPPVQHDFYVDCVSGVDDPRRRGTQEEPFRTINYASSRAVNPTPANPHRIHVARGEYVEFLICDSNERYYGGYNPTTWTRNPALNETIIRGLPAPNQAATVVLEGNCVVDGFTITGGMTHPEHTAGGDWWGDPIGAAVDFDGYEGTWGSATVSNCLITGNNGGTFGVEGQGGVVVVDWGATLYLTNNRIIGNIGNGVGVFYATAVLQDNIIADCQFGDRDDASGLYVCSDSYVSLEGGALLRNENGIYAEGIWATPPGGTPFLVLPPPKITTTNSSPADYTLIAGNKNVGIYTQRHVDIDLGFVVLAQNVNGACAVTENSKIEEDGWEHHFLVHDSIIIGNNYSGNDDTPNGCYFEVGNNAFKNNFIVSNGPVYVYDSHGDKYTRPDLVTVYESLNNSVLYNNGGYVGRNLWWHELVLCNDLFWDNLDDITVTSKAGPFWSTYNMEYTNIEDGDDNEWDSNVHVDPDFLADRARPATVGVAEEITFDSETGESTVVDSSLDLEPDELARAFLWLEGSALYIKSNTANEITVFGNARLAASAGSVYTVEDYRLDPLSACVDIARDGLDVLKHDFENDPRPFDVGRGMLVDMGADEAVVPLFENLVITPNPANETDLLTIVVDSTLDLMDDPEITVGGNPDTRESQVDRTY
ncbi:MAG TPA: right-handed parallel beta-helix repeat-containing protein, partial [Candidatus Hydrogenedentes bacterium]|nr:right-handed parallel beta-helix repeat-containing protein [Candidatus Hydrogenedentota bacterium]